MDTQSEASHDANGTVDHKGDTGNGKSFEENMARLEMLVSQLERGELSLEDALKCYQEGVALAGYCRQSLERTATEVEVLTESMNKSV